MYTADMDVKSVFSDTIISKYVISKMHLVPTWKRGVILSYTCTLLPLKKYLKVKKIRLEIFETWEYQIVAFMYVFSI